MAVWLHENNLQTWSAKTDRQGQPRPDRRREEQSQSATQWDGEERRTCAVQWSLWQVWQKEETTNVIAGVKVRSIVTLGRMCVLGMATENTTLERAVP